MRIAWKMLKTEEPVRGHRLDRMIEPLNGDVRERAAALTQRYQDRDFPIGAMPFQHAL